ncbi:CoA ester lyase [Bradyrhizobium sp. 2TAF36]|uniref:HpcH/HpaI aldolase/citrate lyase family protein n=1 Tax=Bradyrhizobium sp. 2TAF36 TaxID=3233016 RepID=UPI003F910980
MPRSDRAAQMHALDAAITHWERELKIATNSTDILPVCETARGVVEVCSIAASSPRIRCAFLGAEDHSNDLCAERGIDAVELDYARRRFILEARAAGIEPIDAPYTFSDVEGAVREAAFSRRLGYRSKFLVRPAHAVALNAVFTPSADELARASAIVEGFGAARKRGEDRAQIDGLWIEVPTYRNGAD